MSDFFYSLEPQHILEAVEQLGVRSTGRCYALNSLENRVYEVELEEGFAGESLVGETFNGGSSKVVGKFYRPGRWSKEAILEEHEFLHDLALAEVPVVEPLKLQNGSTIGVAEGGILFSVFPKVQGRAPEELKDDQALQLGRLIARLHNVGAQKKAPHRLVLNPVTYGESALDFIMNGGWLPLELASRYETVVKDIIRIITPWFENIATHRIHGDCHLGNLLYNKAGPFFLDFDDMVTGPPAQDMWLLMPGQDEQTLAQREIFIKGYTEMREFDRSTLRLIEPLRALRIVHYTAWVAKRWQDPAFPRVFTEFNTHKYWDAEIRALTKQLDIISGAPPKPVYAESDWH